MTTIYEFQDADDDTLDVPIEARAREALAQAAAAETRAAEAERGRLDAAEVAEAAEARARDAAEAIARVCLWVSECHDVHPDEGEDYEKWLVGWVQFMAGWVQRLIQERMAAEEQVCTEIEQGLRAAGLDVPTHATPADLVAAALAAREAGREEGRAALAAKMREALALDDGPVTDEYLASLAAALADAPGLQREMAALSKAQRRAHALVDAAAAPSPKSTPAVCIPSTYPRGALERMARRGDVDTGAVADPEAAPKGGTPEPGCEHCENGSTFEYAHDGTTEYPCPFCQEPDTTPEPPAAPTEPDEPAWPGDVPVHVDPRGRKLRPWRGGIYPPAAAPTKPAERIIPPVTMSGPEEADDDARRAAAPYQPRVGDEREALGPECFGGEDYPAVTAESLNAPQPPPRPAPGPAAWDLVRVDIEERDRMGTVKYGQRLTPGDGRDTLVDAYQEALDLVVYLRKAIAERSPVRPTSDEPGEVE